MILFFSFLCLSSSITFGSEQHGFASKTYKEFERFGSWTESTELNGLISDEIGSKLCFQLEGSRLQVIGRLLTNDSIINIRIDEVNYPIDITYLYDTAKDQILLNKELASEIHEIEIKLIQGRVLIKSAKISITDTVPKLHGLFNERHVIQFYNMQSVGVWTDETLQSWANTKNAYKEFTFYGTKFFIYAKVASHHGDMGISLDGNTIATISTSMTPEQEKKLVYTSEDLIYKKHTVRLTFVTKAIGISCCEYIGHAPYSVFTQGNFIERYSFSTWRPAWLGVGTEDPNGTMTLTEVCKRIVVYGRYDKNNGEVKIIFDDQETTVNTESSTTLNKQVVFDSQEVEYKSHTITLKRISKYVQINGMTYYSNTGSVSFNVEVTRREIYSGSSTFLRISKLGEDVGNYTIVLNAESNKDSSYFEPLNLEILFEEDDTEKIIKIETKYANTETLNYSIKCTIRDLDNAVTFGEVEVTVMCFNIPADLQRIEYSGFTKSDGWVSDTSGVGGSAGVGESASATFTGTFLVIYGKVGPSFGEMRITIDSTSTTINTHDYGSADTFLFVFPYLLYGEHTISLECVNDKIGLNYMTYYSEPQYGSLQFESTSISVHKGMSFLLRINRFDGVTGRVTCKLNIKNNNVPDNNVKIDSLDNGGSGVSPSREVSFEAGVTFQEVRILTYSDFESQASTTYSFDVELIEPSGGAKIGSVNNVVTVTVIDDAYPSEQIFEVPFVEMEQKSGWNNQIEETGGGWTGNANAYKEMTFVGVRAYVYGFIAFNHGDIDIFIDGNFITTINTTGKTRNVRYLLYVSPILEHGQHTIKAQRKRGDVGLCFFRYYDTWEHGLFNIEHPEYVIELNGTVYVNILRTKGTKGEIKVRVEGINENASNNQYDNFNQNIAFANGESKKNFIIFSNVKSNSGNNYTLKIKLTRFEGKPGSLGKNIVSKLVLMDTKYPLERRVQIPFGSLTKGGDWSGEPVNYGGWTGTKDRYVEATFKGVKGFLYTYISHDHGECIISLDGKNVGTYNTRGPRRLSSLLYVTPDLNYGEHTLKVTVVGNGAVGVNFVNYLTGFFPTKMFTNSDVMSLTSNFMKTEIFSSSSNFIPSDFYSKTSEYTFSNRFSITNEFETTKSFSYSVNFEITNLFSISSQMTNSNDFENSNSFSKSIEFDFSNKFSKSSIFGISNDFSISGLFSVSSSFAKTKLYSNSKAFEFSDQFSISRSHDSSKIFSFSNDFEQSDIFSSSQTSIKENIETSIEINKLDSSMMDENIADSSFQLNVDKVEESSIIWNNEDDRVDSSIKDEPIFHEVSSIDDMQDLITSIDDVQGYATSIDDIQDFATSINQEKSIEVIEDRYSSNEEAKDPQQNDNSSETKDSQAQTDDLSSINEIIEHQNDKASSDYIESIYTSIHEYEKLDSSLKDANLATSIEDNDNEHQVSSDVSQKEENEMKIESSTKDSIHVNDAKSLTDEILTSHKNSQQLDEIIESSINKEENVKESGFIFIRDEESSIKLNIESVLPSQTILNDIDATETHDTYESSSLKIINENENGIESSLNKVGGIIIESIHYTDELTSLQIKLESSYNKIIEQESKIESVSKHINDNDSEKQRTTVANMEFEQNSSDISIISDEKKDPANEIIENSKKEKQLNGGQIAGIIIGVLLAILIILILIYFFHIKLNENISYSESIDEFLSEETISTMMTTEATMSNPELGFDDEVQYGSFIYSDDYDEMPNELINKNE